MSTFVEKRMFPGLLGTGLAATLVCFTLTLAIWPVWGLVCKGLATVMAGTGLAAAPEKMAAKYISVFTEGLFFYLIINSWIWQVLIFGSYAKTSKGTAQPGVGIRYTLWAIVWGAAVMLFLIAFMGLTWKPFSLAVMFCPKTADDVHMAIEGWELINFYTVAVLMAQIPAAGLMHKWPFAGKIAAPWDGFGVMMTSTVLALLVWLALIFPGLVKLQLGGHEITTVAFGSWPGTLAFAQAYIWWFLIPAEGGEHYPMKLFAKTQPTMGLVGFVIALVMGYVTLLVMRPVMTSLDLMPGAPVDLLIASVMISIITVTLLWHHIFDDYPTAAMCSSVPVRVLTRIAIWVVVGFIWGIIWIKIYKALPFGANDLGLGIGTPGILAGQFAWLMTFLFLNTHFDKWPFVKKIPAAEAK